ncbi:hypothetical protein LAZ67_1007592 [Cordylochernes scorpioides]|uniref:Uncharacterized protein n=1 Tax=Cordylochernes scorpioides TaxID=51811 RepID=A0ABY6K490_9ARAC|nr:hypothetical protein LAZ67_1007592 [Cordylochernes scorpioides]
MATSTAVVLVEEMVIRCIKLMKERCGVNKEEQIASAQVAGGPSAGFSSISVNCLYSLKLQLIAIEVGIGDEVHLSNPDVVDLPVAVRVHMESEMIHEIPEFWRNIVDSNSTQIFVDPICRSGRGGVVHIFFTFGVQS